MPVIFLKDVEGQLFADLSLTIAFAVFVSLIVAVTVVPVASMLFLRTRPKVAELAVVWRGITDYIMNLTDTPMKRRYWIGGLILGSIVGTWLLTPSLQYLPQVKRAAIDGFIQYPAGATIDFADKQIAQPIRDRLQPYMTGKKQPQLLNYYIQNYGPGAMGIGVRVPNDRDFPLLEKIVRKEIIKDLPELAGLRADGQPLRRLRRRRRHRHQCAVERCRSDAPRRKKRLRPAAEALPRCRDQYESVARIRSAAAETDRRRPRHRGSRLDPRRHRQHHADVRRRELCRPAL